MKRTLHILIGIVVLAMVSALVTSCGSSKDDNSALLFLLAGSDVVSRGAMTKGSTTVNGIKYEDTAANITGDDTAKTTADLKDGMMVKVKGKKNFDDATGRADRIEIENEARGMVSGNPVDDTMNVLGQTVLVTGATILAGGVTFSGGAIGGLSDGDFVEVHGERLAGGTIVATRVEKLVGAPAEDELRGIAVNVTGTQFDIGALTISYSGGTPIVPAGASLTEGALVEVHLQAGTTTATRIEIEDAEDAEFEPAEGQELEFEGYVSNYDNVSDFDIDLQHVRLTGSTRYESGIYADLANDARVEAEGHMSGGVLVAEKITFKDSIRIEAPADGNGSPDVLGLTVVTTSATDQTGLTTPITAGQNLRIRGFPNGDGSVTATRIDDGGGGGGSVILQGPVHTISSGPAYTFMILSITVNAAGASEVKDDNDVVMNKDLFFASLTPNRTVVKARGTYGAGTLTADKIEIE